MGILQARILEWVAAPSSRRSSQPRDRIQVSLTAGRFFTTWATREAHFRYKPSSLLTDDDPMSLVPPLPLCADEETKAPKSKAESRQGSPRALKWVAYPFSRGSFQPRNWTGVSCIAGGFFTCWATRGAPLLRGLALYWEGASSPSITCCIWTQRDVDWVWGSFSRPGIVVTKQSRKYMPFTMQAQARGSCLA